VDVLTLERYSRTPLRLRFNKEFRFHVMGNLRGKRLLDVGCGDGRNAVLLARLGAQVEGIDISPGAIELARERALVNGVADSAHFTCSPLEIAEFVPDSYDVIWGDAILHHLIPELEMVLGKLTSWAKPGSLIVFAEPINLNQTLRRFRQALPVHTEATPGERPLEAAEINLLRRYIPDLVLRPFSFMSRFDRFVIKDHNFEASSLSRRLFATVTASLDYMLLSLPLSRNLAGQGVIYGHPKK
jgi:SAM-dependent methyltransferase